MREPSRGAKFGIGRAFTSMRTGAATACSISEVRGGGSVAGCACAR
ncbi:hypothetical protein ACVWW3_006348 [Bradyrhizobium sp. LM2.9]